MANVPMHGRINLGPIPEGPTPITALNHSLQPVDVISTPPQESQTQDLVGGLLDGELIPGVSNKFLFLALVVFVAYKGTKGN